MKKYIRYLIIPLLLLFLIPTTANAQSVTYVDGGVFYYRPSLDTSAISNSYSFNSGVLPVYPIATDNNTVPLMVHNALQFIIANPSTNKVGRSYTATIEFTYMFDGFSSNIKPDNPYLVGGLYPVQGESIITSSSNSVTVLESTATYAKVKIVYNANLNGSYQLDNFIVSLSSTGKYGLADCGTSTGEGNCRNVLVAQLSLLSVDIDISNDLNTGLLNNINTNQQITNEKLDQVNNTNKGIWDTIKDLPNKFMDMLKSLFIPEDDYFSNKFNELKDNITNILGFLAYPLTLITKTFNFFLTVEDTGSYVISWPDVTVPNFEDHVIIQAGSFDLGQLLENSKISSLRNIAFVFINALLLLAFLQLCKNQYSKVFGGDISTTEFISVSDEYDIDYHTGEVTNMKHIEKKTTRRDID